MKNQLVFMLVVGLLVMAGSSVAQAGGAHPYFKLGIELNGDYGEPFGFEDRLLYCGGVDVQISDLIAVGPEFEFQRISAKETVFGIEYDFTQNVYEFYGNFVVTPAADAPVAPYFGAGVGVAHVTVEGDIEHFVVLEDSVTKPTIHAYGGIQFAKHVVTEFEVERIIMDDVDTEVSVNFGVRF